MTQVANDENLLKGEATRFKSGEEAARNGRKGGIKSGITRRRKGASRKYLKELLAMTPCLNEKDMKLLEKMGVTDEQKYFQRFVDDYNRIAVPYKKIGLLRVRADEFPKNTLRKILRRKMDMTID